MFFPDYKGIEIKCTQRYSNYPIGLFSVAFDGPRLYETNQILEEFGKTDKLFKNRKTLIIDLNTKKLTEYNNYRFNIKIDKTNKKIYLNVLDTNLNIIYNHAYIEFKTIQEKINIKLNKLALVYASKKYIDNSKYFRYYAIKFYQLKDIDKFLNLIERNIIKLELMCRVSRTGEDIGRQKNKGILFSISKDDFDKLFTPIFKYNNDIELNRLV